MTLCPLVVAIWSNFFLVSTLVVFVEIVIFKIQSLATDVERGRQPKQLRAGHPTKTRAKESSTVNTLSVLIALKKVELGTFGHVWKIFDYVSCNVIYTFMMYFLNLIILSGR